MLTILNYLCMGLSSTKLSLAMVIPMLVVCNMCLILTVSYYLLLRTAEPQLGWGVARAGGSRGVRSNWGYLVRVWGEDNSTVKTDKFLNAEKAFKLLFFNDSRVFTLQKMQMMPVHYV